MEKKNIVITVLLVLVILSFLIFGFIGLTFFYNSAFVAGQDDFKLQLKGAGQSCKPFSIILENEQFTFIEACGFSDEI